MTRCRIDFLVFVLLLAAAVPLAAEVRTWTLRSGTGATEAEFIDANNGDVWLKVPDAGVIHLPLDTLVDADRQYVAKLLDDERQQRAAAAPPDGPQTIHYGPGRLLANLQNAALTESSGVAPSHRVPGYFWSHNDSENEPRLFLFDRAGRDLGSCKLKGVEAYDWEDMASFIEDGKPRLLMADTGNNGLNSAVQMIHILEEPPIDPQRGVLVDEVPVLRTLFVSFEDDFRNCEAVGIDPTDKTIVLISKERGPTCHAYVLRWPATDGPRAHTAKLVATLRLRQVTGLCISPDGRRAVVITYNNAFEFLRRENEDWAAALGRGPREIAVPSRKQGESICFGLDGKTLYLTSERRPTPLIEVPVTGIGNE